MYDHAYYFLSPWKISKLHFSVIFIGSKRDGGTVHRGLTLIIEHFNRVIVDSNIKTGVGKRLLDFIWRMLKIAILLHKIKHDFFFYCIQFYFTVGRLVPHYAIPYLKTNRAAETDDYTYHGGYVKLFAKLTKRGFE